MNNSDRDRGKADRLAPVMFGLSLLFLILLAALVVIFIDIPRVAELAALDSVEVTGSTPTMMQVQSGLLVEASAKFGKYVVIVLMMLWPVFWLEYLYSSKVSTVTTRFVPDVLFRALACLLPPLRLATPSSIRRGQIWLPYLQWRYPGKTLSRSLERLFSKPMLIIALLILPILLVEFGLQRLVEEKSWLRMILHVSTGFIWCAFATEFIVMINATDKKLAYVKKNWIDLAIILLPLLSFLRTFRLLRLAKFAKIQQLAKMGRVYRLKGLSSKVLRALMLFGVVNRILRVTPEKKLKKLKKKFNEKTEELNELENQISHLEAQLRSDPD